MALCGCIRIPSCSNPIDMYGGVERSVYYYPIYLFIYVIIISASCLYYLLYRVVFILQYCHTIPPYPPSRQPTTELNGTQPHTALQCTWWLDEGKGRVRAIECRAIWALRPGVYAYAT